MKMKILRLFIAAGILLPGLWSPAAAGEVRLKNGDRLTGKIVKMEGEVLVLKTDYAGKISLKWDQVECIKSENQHTFVLKDQRKITGRIECPSDGVIGILDEQTGLSETLPGDAFQAINPLPPIRYKGNIVMGGNMAAGNTDTQGANTAATLQIRERPHRWTVNARGYYNETNNTMDAQNALGSVKYDYFITKKLFTYVQVLLEHDKMQDLDLRYAAGPGLGYQFVDTPAAKLFTEAGVSYVSEKYGANLDREYASGRWSVGFNWEILPDRVKFFHLHEGYIRLEDTEDFHFRSQQGFRLPLINNFYANIQFDYDYINRPATGKKHYDQRYIFGLGYDFEF